MPPLKSEELALCVYPRLWNCYLSLPLIGTTLYEILAYISSRHSPPFTLSERTTYTRLQSNGETARVMVERH